jgi:hypothetical protein
MNFGFDGFIREMGTAPGAEICIIIVFKIARIAGFHRKPP